MTGARTTAPAICDEDGKKAFEESRKLYIAKNMVELFTRDRHSYEIEQKDFSCHNYLVPDIVLSLGLQKPTVRNAAILFCPRNCIEKGFSTEGF